MDPLPWHHHLSHLLRTSTTLRHLKSIHSFLLTTGLLLPPPTSPSPSPSLLSRLLLASASLNSLPYTSLLLLHSPSPPSLNSLILSSSRSPAPHLSLPFFLLLLRSPSRPDHLSFPPAISSCSSSPSLLPAGAQLHSLSLKFSFPSSDPFVLASLLRFYSAHGLVPLARQLFDEFPDPDAVHLDILMNAYIRSAASPDDALRLFSNAGVEPDAHTVATALTACSHAGALGRGSWVHDHLLSDDMLEDSYVASALINMYAKCGSIERATEVFESIQHRNRFVWSAMIGGFAVHGLADHAVECLRRMQHERMRPDGVIMLNVLSACAHAGLVSEGLQLLFEMEPRYDIVPQHEHYSCAVDMLCRVGRLDDALELIRKMPIRPLASVWGSLLTGCRLYGNVELAEMAVAELQGLTEDDEGVYVQLSDIYRDAGRLEDARRARRLVGRRGTKKTAAWSSVEVEGAASSFLAGDCVHPRRVEIGRMLELVTENISWNLDPLCRNIYDREIISPVMTE